MTESEIVLDPDMTEEAFNDAKKGARENGGISGLKLPFRKGEVVEFHTVQSILSKTCRMFSKQELHAQHAELSQIRGVDYMLNLETAYIEMIRELLGEDISITLAANEGCKADAVGVFIGTNGVKKSIALQLTAATSSRRKGYFVFGKTDCQMREYNKLGIVTAMFAMNRVAYDPNDENNINDRYVDLLHPQLIHPTIAHFIFLLYCVVMWND